jgi:hypothetical protein
MRPVALVYDIRNPSGEYLSFAEYTEMVEQLPTVPLVSSYFTFDYERMQMVANGPSLMAGADHLREGIVVKPKVERTHPEIGRVILKLHGSDFLGKD